MEKEAKIPMLKTVKRMINMIKKQTKKIKNISIPVVNNSLTRKITIRN